MSFSRILGDLVQTDDGKLEGWCWSMDRPQERAVVEILVNSDIVSVLTAAQKRDDLVVLGIGDGYHFFSLPLPILYNADALDVIIEARERVSHVIFGRIVVRKRMSRPVYDVKLRDAMDAVQTLSATLNNHRVKSSGRKFHDDLSDLGLVIRGRARNIHSPQAARSTLAVKIEVLNSAPPLDLPYFSVPAVTVISPALDNWRSTFASLRALRSILEKFMGEIILVDDGTDPATALLATRVRNLRYVRHTGRVFNAAAVNLSALNARGRRLFFINWPTALAPSKLRQLMSIKSDSIFFDARMSEIADNFDLTGTVALPPPRVAGSYLYMSMLRSTFFDVGGFDESPDDFEATPVDFLLKAHLLGVGLISL